MLMSDVKKSRPSEAVCPPPPLHHHGRFAALSEEERHSCVIARWSDRQQSERDPASLFLPTNYLLMTACLAREDAAPLFLGGPSRCRSDKTLSRQPSTSAAMLLSARRHVRACTCWCAFGVFFGLKKIKNKTN